MISLKIDVTKISKDRLFIGKKGKYLDALLIPTPEAQFGDYMIVESLSKEERQAGKKRVILGNGNNVAKSNQSSPQAPPMPEDDEIPF